MLAWSGSSQLQSRGFMATLLPSYYYVFGSSILFDRSVPRHWWIVLFFKCQICGTSVLYLFTGALLYGGSLSFLHHSSFNSLSWLILFEGLVLISIVFLIFLMLLNCRGNYSIVLDVYLIRRESFRVIWGPCRAAVLADWETHVQWMLRFCSQCFCLLSLFGGFGLFIILCLFHTSQ